MKEALKDYKAVKGLQTTIVFNPKWLLNIDPKIAASVFRVKLQHVLDGRGWVADIKVVDIDLGGNHA